MLGSTHLELKIWDISPAVNAQAAIFPGDTPYSQRLHFTHGPDCPVNVHSITMSPHTGAHADAPLHYAPGGASAGALDLHAYLGPCRVVHLAGFASASGLIEPEHLAAALRASAPQRVLVRTSAQASQSWGGFVAFSSATIDMLAAHGMLLVGLDTPSVDPADSKDLPSHQALLRHKMRVLENLVLDDVPEGDYELIALPLKLTDCDASPVRAVLRELTTHTP